MNFSLYLTFGSQDIYMKNILFPWSLSEQRRCTKRAVIASAIKFDWLTGKKQSTVLTPYGNQNRIVKARELPPWQLTQDPEGT